jgi:hypothetical protein
MESLEFFSRIHMGQFDQIDYTLYMDTYDKTLKREKFDREAAEELLLQAKQVIFPSLDRSAYIGIMQCNERSKISWDIYQQLRYDLGKDELKKPFKVSQQPLPVITITEE